MTASKWTTEENEYLMESAHRIPWAKIAEDLGRTEAAVKAKYEKIRKLRIRTGTWEGI